MNKAMYNPWRTGDAIGRRFPGVELPMVNPTALAAELVDRIAYNWIRLGTGWALAGWTVTTSN